MNTPSIPVPTYSGEDEYETTCLSDGVVGIRPGKNPLLEGNCIVFLRYRFPDQWHEHE